MAVDGMIDKKDTLFFHGSIELDTPIRQGGSLYPQVRSPLRSI